MPAIKRWNVSLAAWIIQDGNYPDLNSGQHADFAIEFWPLGALQRADDDELFVRHIRDETYDVVAEVVAVGEGWWVIRIADLEMYQESPAPPGLSIGTRAKGQVGLGIDPFFYFEYLNRSNGIPPLVYSFRIASIARSQAPPSETAVSASGTENRWGWDSVEETNAEEDNDGYASYLLECELLPSPPKRMSTTAK